MKFLKYSITTLLFVAAFHSLAQEAIGTNNPNPQAALHIASPNKGLLIPKLALSNATTFIGSGTDAQSDTGMLVFNTNTDTSDTGLNGSGFYYWSTNFWEKLSDLTELNEKTSHVPLWVSNTNGGVYAIHDIVSQSGVLYKNRTGTNTDTAPSTDTTNWEALGDTSIPLWKSNTNGRVYAINDVINHNGILYKNLTGVNTDTTPDLDATNWAREDKLLGLQDKLDNTENLGTTLIRGTVFPTSNNSRVFADVVNAYLVNDLSPEEIEYILQNRDDYSIEIGLGDRRDIQVERIEYLSLGNAEGVQTLPIVQPGDVVYNFEVTLTNDGQLTVTDGHVSQINTYGGVRGLRITPKNVVPTWKSESDLGTYGVNDIISYNGVQYRNLTGLNSDITPNADTTNWERVVNDDPVWVANASYGAGDVVLYNGRRFTNTLGSNTATNPDADILNWEASDLTHTRTLMPRRLQRRLSATGSSVGSITLGDNSTTAYSNVLFAGGAMNGSGTQYVFYLNQNGNAAKSGGGSWASTSDERTKKDIKDFNVGLEEVIKLRPVSFKYNGKYDTPTDEKEHVSFIAQEVEKIAPRMINKIDIPGSDAVGENALKLLENSDFVPMLVNAVKELKEKNDELEARIKALESAMEPKQ